MKQEQASESAPGGAWKKDAEKIRVSRVVVVEGRYDKGKLASILDADIVTTEGFGIFKDKEKTAFFRRLAETRGLIVLTDPDGAGLVIRHYFSSILPPEQVIHLYLPPRKGKEKRKKAPSKEGWLGVEGADPALLRALFLPFAEQVAEKSPVSAKTPARESAAKSPVSADGPARRNAEKFPVSPVPVTPTAFFEDGFRGRENSESRRKMLARAADLPENLSAKALLAAINLLGGRPFYEDCLSRLPRP